MSVATTLKEVTVEREREMASDKVVETVIVGNYEEMETDEGKPKSVKNKMSSLFWHGGSVYDAWFSCASNQVRCQKPDLPHQLLSPFR